LPKVRRIPNMIEAKQDLVGGLTTTFDTGVDGTVGIAGDGALIHNLPLNRDNPPFGAGIFGPFLVAGDAPPEFRLLRPLGLEQLLDTICPELPQEQFLAFINAPTAETSGWRCRIDGIV
jgi:hypothetical protein